MSYPVVLSFESGCSLDNTGIEEPFRAVFPDTRNAIVLDRSLAKLVCVDNESGTEKWSLDGSESGESFIDPAYLSRSDGFYFYLTDYGSRSVWRIDTRGEIRGRVELPMAADPLFFELARGGDFVLYDRARGTVHLLDDSAQPLWEFDAGLSVRSGEPLDMVCSRSGDTIYLFWKTVEGLLVSQIDIFGSSTREIPLELENAAEVRSVCAEEILTPDRDNPPALLVMINNSKLYLIDINKRKPEEIFPEHENIQDIYSENGLLYILSGNPPAIERFRLERDN